MEFSVKCKCQIGENSIQFALKCNMKPIRHKIDSMSDQKQLKNISIYENLS